MTRKQIEVVTCDRHGCGKEGTPGAHRFAPEIERRWNGTDNDTITVPVDLCPACIAAELRALIAAMTFTEATTWVQRVKYGRMAHGNS